jgi:hypothetical protein
LSYLKTSCLALAILSGSAISMAAQQPPKIDLAVTYSAGRSLKAASGQNFWLQGGSVEFGADAYKGWGIAVEVTGLHAASIGGSGIPLSLVVATFGPRYRWHGRKFSVYSEGLVGEANGFDSFFPGKFSAQSSSNGLATQVGGGVDYRLSRRFAFRVVDAKWLRTQLPNSTDNVQNTLQLSSGIVWRLGSR